MKVNEIFRSIQGESSYVGMPCVFIRLTGCNLRCSYCDTKYAYEEGDEMSIKSIIREVEKLFKKGDIIEITGGEPLLQKEELEELVDYFYDIYECPVLVETNGSIEIPEMWPCEWIMDWKLGSSIMGDKMLKENLDRLTEFDELKFVVGSEKDYNEMKKILKKYKPKCDVLVSTIWEKDIRKFVVESLLKDGLEVRFQVQLHKIVWNKTKRRV